MVKKRKYKIPFVFERTLEYVKNQGWVSKGDPVWNMYEYAYHEEPEDPGFHNRDYTYEWRDVYEFTDHLKIVEWEKGRGSVRIILQGTDGTIYSATLSAFMNALALTDCLNEVIQPIKWTFRKRGSNYTIVPVDSL